MKTLNELANAFGTDKGTSVGNKHGYTLVYEDLFSGMRDREIDLLEVGLSIGGPEQGFEASRQVLSVPSVDMWLSYFSKANVTGLDISDCSQFQKERFQFIQADCGNQTDLQKAADQRQFDIIIDDGSHASFHQQLTMLALFPALRSGGYYIVEDLDWQPEAYERELPPVPKTARLAEWLANPSGLASYGLFDVSRWLEIAGQASSIQIYRKYDLEALVPEHLKLRHGYFKRRRMARRKRILGEFGNPIKLAVIQKK